MGNIFLSCFCITLYVFFAFYDISCLIFCNDSLEDCLDDYLDDYCIDLIEKIKLQHSIISKVKSNTKPLPEFNSDYNLYLRDVSKPQHILAVNNSNANEIKKETYTLNGVFIESIVDKIINDKTVHKKLRNKKI